MVRSTRRGIDWHRPISYGWLVAVLLFSIGMGMAVWQHGLLKKAEQDFASLATEYNNLGAFAQVQQEALKIQKESIIALIVEIEACESEKKKGQREL